MNCRRVSSLLSAYLDAELTGAEMLEIGSHLEQCPHCRGEYQGLRDTKHLLASLALQTPRADLEALLRAQVERANHPRVRWLPSWFLAGTGERISLPRPRPLIAAAALSLATLLLAASTLDTSSRVPDRSVQSAHVVTIPDVYAQYPYGEPVGPNFVYSAALPIPERSPLAWRPGGSSVVLLSYNRGR